GVLHFPDDYYSWLVHANLLAQSGYMADARRASDEAHRLLPQLTLAIAIALTEKTYGRTEAQRAWLTGGLRLLAEGGKPAERFHSIGHGGERGAPPACRACAGSGVASL